MFEPQITLCVDSRTIDIAGNNSAISTLITAMETSKSIIVNAERARRLILDDCAFQSKGDPITLVRDNSFEPYAYPTATKP